MNGQGKARFQLPAAEDDLWEQVVLALLTQRHVSEWEAGYHLRLLEELGFHSRICEKRLTYAFALKTATWLAEEMKLGNPGDRTREWLEDLERWELLLRRGSGHDATYEFAIPTLDEYFAARHLAARWAEEDERYRSWLPCTEGWWEQGRKLHCPNPHCRATLPPFRDLLFQPEYEETLLLMVGLLKTAEREEKFLDGIRGDLDFLLKAMSRCHFGHPTIAQAVKNDVVTRFVRDGLAALGQARTQGNLDHILNYCMDTLRKDRRWYRRRDAAYALGRIGDPRAVELLIAVLLTDKSFRVRERAAFDLGIIGDTQAVEALIAALKDEDYNVRSAAAWALGDLGDTQAVPVLQRLLGERGIGSGWVRGSAQRAIEKIERQTGAESR